MKLFRTVYENLFLNNRGVGHRLAGRRTRLGIERFEERDVPTTGLYPVVSATIGGKSELFGLTSNGRVDESTNSGTTWFAVTGSNTDATALVSADGGVFLLGSNGAPNQTVYEYTGSGTNWTAVTGPNTAATGLVGADGGLFLLGTNGSVDQTVYKYTGSGTNWTAVTGTTPGFNATAMVGADGGLFILGGQGEGRQKIYKYSGAGTAWQAVGGFENDITQLVGTAGGLFARGGGPGYETAFEYDNADNTWSAISGQNVWVFQLVDGAGTLYMVASTNGTTAAGTWRYTGPGDHWTALTGTSLEAAVSTWPLAATHPEAGVAYSPASGPLFGPGGPSYRDVQQGDLADCWLLASLAEVAARDPDDIRHMFVYDGKAVENGATVGVYTVRIYTPDGNARDVMVDTELPAGGGADAYPVNHVLWVSLAEKAYAEANAVGYVVSNNRYQNAYSALNYGYASWALEAITGKSAKDYSLNTGKLAGDWNAGDLIVLGTDNPTSPYVVGDHCYAVVGYTASSSQPFKIFNPWGTDAAGWAPGCSGTVYGLFNASTSFISQNFVGQGIGHGTAPVPGPGTSAAPDFVAGSGPTRDPSPTTAGGSNSGDYHKRLDVVDAAVNAVYVGTDSVAPFPAGTSRGW